MIRQQILFGTFNIINKLSTMYKKTDKRRLYWLIDQYLSGKIDETTFCNDFHDTLVNEMYYKGLTTTEFKIFNDLRDVAQRFSKYKGDIKIWPGFITAGELKQKIMETKDKLREQTPE